MFLFFIFVFIHFDRISFPIVSIMGYYLEVKGRTQHNQPTGNTMFKIHLIESTTDHNGNHFNGFANIDGAVLIFDSFKTALEFMVKHSEFFGEFTAEIVPA